MYMVLIKKIATLFRKVKHAVFFWFGIWSIAWRPINRHLEFQHTDYHISFIYRHIDELCVCHNVMEDDHGDFQLCSHWYLCSVDDCQPKLFISNEEISKPNFELHLLFCLRHQSRCPKCNEMCLNSQMSEHLLDAHSMVNCSDCSMEVEKYKLPDHAVWFIFLFSSCIDDGRWSAKNAKWFVNSAISIWLDRWWKSI